MYDNSLKANSYVYSAFSGELKEILQNIITQVGATSIKDMGKVMGVLKKEYSDNLDFSKAGSYLKETFDK